MAYELSGLARTIGMPLCILDTETTGLLCDPVVGLVEFAFIKVNPDGSHSRGSTLLHPGIPIPWQASKVHGITDSTIANEKPFPAIFPQVKSFFSDCVICGFNSREYDVPVLQSNAVRYQLEALTAHHQLDVRDVWIAHAKSQRGNLSVVAGHYGVNPGTAHRAAGDVDTTVSILRAMVQQHGADFVLQSYLPDGKKQSRPFFQSHSAASKPASDRPVKVTEPKEPKPPSKTARTRQMVLDWVARHQYIAAKDYAEIGQMAEVPVTSVSFAVSELYAQGALLDAQIADESIQDVILAHLEEALEIAGGGEKLKPIKMALDTLTNQDIDYVQLRVAFNTYAADKEISRQSNQDVPRLG